MPTSSDIVIRVAGTDVTNYVMYQTARFESQRGALPGSFEMTLKDPDQVLDFTEGDEVTCEIDGVRMWGGFAFTVARTFAFPVVDTTTPANVKARLWKLSGLDYNILFDKRVLRNPDDYLSALPEFGLDLTMGELIRDVLPNYLDIDDDGLDLSTDVDDTYVPRFDEDGNPDPDGSVSGSWPQQGSYWRAAMEDFAQFGTIYYLDAAKKLQFHEVEDSAAAWGFSDVPNNLPLPDASATYGMREFEEIRDAGGMANDAFVWGGSEFSGPGNTVFARKENAASIAAHRRWQIAETRFGDLRNQGEVRARANVIVSGNTTGAVGGDTSRGLAVDQQQVRLAWFGHDVPEIAGQKQHLLPSQVVTMSMYVLGTGGLPLVIVLPLRTVKITFPTLPASGSTPEAPKTYVRFDGFFGVQLSDPYHLWKFLRDLKTETRIVPIATANDDSTVAVFGAYGTFTPSPLPDGATTTFFLPFAYITDTLRVYRNGLLYGAADVTQTSPETGEFEMTTAPLAAASWIATCRVAGGL